MDFEDPFVQAYLHPLPPRIALALCALSLNDFWWFHQKRNTGAHNWHWLRVTVQKLRVQRATASWTVVQQNCESAWKLSRGASARNRKQRQLLRHDIWMQVSYTEGSSILVWLVNLEILKDQAFCWGPTILVCRTADQQTADWPPADWSTVDLTIGTDEDW